MTKYEYFLWAYKLDLIFKRRWLLRVFSLPMPSTTHREAVGEFFYDEQSVAHYIGEDGKAHPITDAEAGKPLYGVSEPVTVRASDFISCAKDVESYYSTLVTNVLLIEYPFEGKIPYQNKRFSGKMMDGLVVEALRSGEVTIEQHLKATRALGYMTVLNQVCVTSATYKTLVPPPDIKERRDALIEKYKDDLGNPVTISRIEQELVQYYKEYMADDPAAGFYLKDKDYSVSLKRSHIMFGGEPKLENPSEMDLIIPSLREGLSLEHLPQMVNSLRMGSYNRGASTALGGEAAKMSARIFQNTNIEGDDCGSTIYYPVDVSAYNVDKLAGRYYSKGGKLERLERGQVKVGERYMLRSPLTCKTPGGNFCKTCLGDAVGNSGIALGPQASAMGSAILELFLSLFHGRALKTKKYDFKQALR